MKENTCCSGSIFRAIIDRDALFLQVSNERAVLTCAGAFAKGIAFCFISLRSLINELQLFNPLTTADLSAKLLYGYPESLYGYPAALNAYSKY